MRPSRKRQQDEEHDEEMVERGMAAFREFLQARSLKHSKVRDEVAVAALKYEGHFTVEDLLRAVRRTGVENAHAATIYRAIPLLLESGLIELALVSHGESQHYERAFEREHHDHLLCTQCGRVVEFHSETLEALQREIAERYDYSLEDHVHELRGLCGRCRRA